MIKFNLDQKCPVRVIDQTNMSPVKTSNLPDNCPMTDCYLQLCGRDKELTV